MEVNEILNSYKEENEEKEFVSYSFTSLLLLLFTSDTIYSLH